MAGEAYHFVGSRSRYRRSMHTRWELLMGLLPLLSTTAATAKHHGNGGDGTGLANAVVLVIRHAEKPDEGPDLSPAGVARARAYVDYFQRLTVDGAAARPNAIFAAARSKASNRPYETVALLARALGLPVGEEFKNDRYAELARTLREKSHGHVILICWHHGEIPALLEALGADPRTVLPDGKWPSSEFSWVIALTFDGNGASPRAARIAEHLMPGDGD
jgi:broad specificity phosphatase PhoE